MITILTKEQHRELFGKEYTKDSLFNPFLDKDGNICISQQEVQQCDNKAVEWVKTLELKEPTEILKEDWTKEQWLQYEKEEAQKRILLLDAELKNDTGIKIKPI